MLVFTALEMGDRQIPGAQWPAKVAWSASPTLKISVYGTRAMAPKVVLWPPQNTHAYVHPHIYIYI